MMMPDDGFDFIIPGLKTSDSSEIESMSLGASVLVEEQKQKPKNDGLTLDEVSKGRTNDKLRNNLMSKLAQQKIWLTPNEKPK
jgi:hypothetical protein